MPFPFEKVLKRPGLKRVLVPFTLGLFIILFIVFFTVSG